MDLLNLAMFCQKHPDELDKSLNTVFFKMQIFKNGHIVLNIVP